MRTRSILVLIAIVLSAAAGESGFDVHEWGTFTSQLDASGRTLEDQGQYDALPDFVYARVATGAVARLGDAPHMRFKRSYRARQRMETPVLYVHSGLDRVIDVAVGFPHGTMTEWFPSAAESRSLAAGGEWLDATGDRIRWPRVQVLAAALHPELADALPTASSNPAADHYFAARDVHAAFLRVNASGAGAPTDEVERFLFYRGIGDFASPLAVRWSDDETLLVTNTLDAAMPGGVVIHRDGGHLYTGILPRLEPNVGVVATLTPGFATDDDSFAVESLRRLLEEAGLHDDEASAMVATWRPTWLTADGVRVLYVLPQSWVDRALPLTVSPAPDAVVRAFVGRAELMPPTVERAVLALAERHRDDADGDAFRTALATLDPRAWRAALGLASSPDQAQSALIQRLLTSHAAGP